MNEWINKHKGLYWPHSLSSNEVPIEAIPVTALEELLAKGKKAAEELVFASADNYINNNDDVQKTFSNNNNELPVAYQVYVDAFNEGYATAWALREIEVQELRAEVERLKGGGWISVEERLPYKDGDRSIMCLVYGPKIGIVCRPYNEYHKVWDDEDYDDTFTEAVGGKITHWQPLPQNPQP